MQSVIPVVPLEMKKAVVANGCSCRNAPSRFSALWCTVISLEHSNSFSELQSMLDSNKQILKTDRKIKQSKKLCK